MDKKLRRIAIDLTPILPGGENGGAKLMTLELIRNLSRLAPECEFLLLTMGQNHEELACLDTHNVRRLLIQSILKKDSRIRRNWCLMPSIFPVPIRIRMKYFISLIFRKLSTESLLRQLNVDLLFCPFTAPFYACPEIPFVSVIYDLQHKTYPQFFSPEECVHREKNFSNACLGAERIICISDYVRSTVINNGQSSAEHVHTVYIRLASRIQKQVNSKKQQWIRDLGLELGTFLLFPANMWPHKNHQMLLTAFGMYLARNRKTNLKLVFTGSSCPWMEYLKNAAKRMSLSQHVVFAKYLTNEEFEGIIHGCKAVIFPSLYEGFGMPVIEAMALGKPILCSNITSLPEIAKEAALYFDPKRPQTIVDAIKTLETKETLIKQLVKQGQQHAAQFSDAMRMAHEYWEIFQKAIISKRNIKRVFLKKRNCQNSDF
ncbi:MAG: glycosyltransferase [Nitrospirae bacterium]|nr:glycosyltransferase [Nitrospirota bacterium]